MKEVEDKLRKSTAVVKLICGVGNNAAWITALDGLDHAKKCRNYKHAVVKAFNDVIKEFHKYEKLLLYSEPNVFFNVESMDVKARKKYGNISNREYYDYWKSMGGVAYQKTFPLLTSLQNKYYKSLLEDGVKDAEHIAWVMTAMVALELAKQMYIKAINECVVGLGLRKKDVEKIFRGFSFQKITSLWEKALLLLCPETSTLGEREIDKRNIEMGIVQLYEAWSAPSLLYDSAIKSAEDYDEIFRTKGEQKKVMQQLAEARNATEEELKKHG